MLLNIHVKNFALIDEADIDLGSGLNILTGETGAGKSILIDAVNAALGGRCKGDVIGGYCEDAFISLVFSIDNKNISDGLEKLDISTEYDSIIISRKISQDRSIFKINDEPVSATKVRAVTELLIDIHGQHEHQSLLKESKQLEIIDKYAQNDTLLSDCEKAFRAYSDAKNELHNFNISEEELSRQIDFLKFEIEEITNASIKEGEREELEQKYKVMNSASSIAADLSNALKLLSNNNENASDLLLKAYKSIESAANYDISLNNNLKQLLDAGEIVSDTIRELRGYADNLDFNPEDLITVERRLDELNRIENKYGKGSDSVEKALNERLEKLSALENYESNKERTIQNIDIYHKEYTKIANKLSENRKKYACELTKDIILALDGLNFLEVCFEIQFSQGEDSSYGNDCVTYLISTNPGEELKPLSQVVSGGELSRIMLGFKTVLTEKDEIGTLIFDEIDTGISGRTAGLVSQKLKTISKYHQVICITHLPQIASMADYHFVIDKSVFNGKTKTIVEKLDENGEIRELTRLLAGGDVSDKAYENALELKRLAKG